MKRNCLIPSVIFLAIVLFLQSGCQEQPRVAPATQSGSAAVTELAAAEPVISPVQVPSEPEPVKVKAKSEAEEPAPRVDFEKVVHDFGRIGPGTKNDCNFKFTNTGNALLKITDVSRSCGCTPYTLAKKEYDPGESGTLKVKYNAGTRSGPVTRYLTVTSNDKSRPKVKLAVKAEIVLKVDHEPRKLNLFLNKENAGCPEVTISSMDGQEFSISRFVSAPAGVTADYTASVQDKKFVLQPKVDLTKLKGRSHGRISVSLTHPECKTITIPFSLLSEFSVTPPTILLLNAESEKPIERVVWVLNNYGNDFEVESVTSSKGIIKVLKREKVGARYRLDLEIIPPAAGDNPRPFVDDLLVNIKDGEQLKTNCRGFYAKKK